ncbi:helix-turn-helix domain-containing protein, partial [Escherichia coli]|nr:helix-turn-helix domain-containing protein [Escherichia coli]
DAVLYIVFIRNPLKLLLKKEIISFEQNTILLGNRKLHALFSCSGNTCVNKIDIDKNVLMQYIQNRTIGSFVTSAHDIWYLSQRIDHPDLFNQLFSQFYISESGIIRNGIIYFILDILKSYQNISPLLINCLHGYASKVESIIHNNVSYNWHVKDMACLLHISVSLLKKKLREENTSFRKIKNQVRMRMAINMLEKTNRSIDNIARECGYNDTSYFICIFKKNFSCSPGKYKRRVSVQRGTAQFHALATVYF